MTGLALHALAGMAQAAEPVNLPQRAQELKNLKWGMFICWSFSTFSGKEWTPDIKDVSFFRAKEVDTDQWAKTAKEDGMGYILFLTKHHDGFCLWDTKTSAEATAGMAETFGQMPEGGCLLVGEKGALSDGRWNTECYVKLSGESKFRGADNHDAAKTVPVTMVRAPDNSHMREWTEACTGGAKTFAPFEIGGHITEIGAAGLVALHIGHDIPWDGAAMKVSGARGRRVGTSVMSSILKGS